MARYMLEGESREIPLNVSLLRNDASIALQVDAGDLPYHTVASLMPNGTLKLHANIPTGLGLKVDQDGRIKTVNE